MSGQHTVLQEPAAAEDAQPLEFDLGHVMTLDQYKRLTSESVDFPCVSYQKSLRPFSSQA